MTKACALVAPIAIAALLAGCGSSKSSSSTTTPSGSSSTPATTSTASGTTAATTTQGAATGAPLSEAAWRKQIDGICAGVTAQGNKVAKPTDLPHLQPYLQQIVNLGLSEVAQIKKVNPPAAFKAGQAAVVADLTNIYDKLQAILNQHLSASGLSTAFRAYPASVQASSQDYISRSKAAGLGSCVVG